MQLPKISGKSPLAKAIRYALSRMPKTRAYLDNGFLELDNNTVERAVKPVAIGRKNWMFAGSERGGKAMAIAFTLIETAICRARHMAVYAEARTMPIRLEFPIVYHDFSMHRSA